MAAKESEKCASPGREIDSYSAVNQRPAGLMPFEHGRRVYRRTGAGAASLAIQSSTTA